MIERLLRGPRVREADVGRDLRELHATREAFAAYRRWASEVGMRNPFGRNHFLELIDSTGSALGVGRVRGARPEVVGGIELVQSGVLV